MKSTALILAAAVIILFLPAVMGGISDFRTNDYEASYSVDTAAGVTSANVTLTQDLFGDDEVNVDSITSDVSTDVPLASSYTAATNVLLVTGLTEDDTRTLTIDYKISGLTDYVGADAGAIVLPFLLVLGVIGCVIAAVYNAVRNTSE